MTTIDNINYEILAEVTLTGAMAKSNYTSMVTLRRPKGRIESWGLRKADGSIELV